MKNVPNWERVVRVVVALAAAVVSLRVIDGPSGWLGAGGALGFALTGLVGVCPACALVGRRLPRQG